MKNIFFFLVMLVTALFNSACNAQTNSNNYDAVFPLAVPEENSLLAKWAKKPVLDSLLISDMEGDDQWKVTSIGEMSYTQDRAVGGKQSLRFRTKMRNDEYLALPGNHKTAEEVSSTPSPFVVGSQTFDITGQSGESSVELEFETPQDWSAYNRVSFWVYLHPTTLPRQHIRIGIHNEGTIPNALTTSNSHYINDLKPGAWNHILFEMPHLPRNKVTKFTIIRQLTGFMEGEDGIATYDIDRLQIQRVETDQYEGWTVSPEKFAFSHVGYRPMDSKIAMVGSGGGDQFQLIDQEGNVVFTGDVSSLKNKNGEFRQLDFSKFQKEGVYRIRSGSLESGLFPINENVWLDPIFKAANFYFCQRCGHEVPGVHKACHMDWQGVRGDVTKAINGGYHDAGDLSQGIWRTAMATFVLMRNLEALTTRNDHDAAELADRLRSEIAWGMQYVLNTNFGDGFHITWSRMRMMTDNIVGNADDVIVYARSVAWENFLTTAVQVKAAMLLEKSHPDLASRARATAMVDWQAGLDSTNSRNTVSIREASWGATAALLLAELTGDEMYKKQAAVFGNQIVACQEQSFVQGIPITGYFYHGTDRRRVIRETHSAFEEAPMIALAMLCKELPQDENWVDWYSAAVLYSDFFMKRGSEIAAPYNMLPNAVWSKTELMNVRDESSRATNMQQFNDGTRLNDEYVLRTFPIWRDRTFHGSTNVQLSSTWALAEAAKLRNDAEGMKLVGQQLEWVLGTNPFGQSLMYGVGYDFAPQFVYILSGTVGGLPVGMDSRAGDKPYWPATNSATFKEMWIEPVNRFMGAVSVYSSQGQSVTSNQPSGKNIEIDAETVQSANGKVSITVTLTGNGKHEIEIKSFNAEGNIASKQIELSGKKAEKIQFELTVADQGKPYVVVITADKNPDLRKEIVGSYNNASLLALK